MTTDVQTGRLQVPGAELHYEVRGRGPLLLVVGQPMTSAPFGPVAERLAADFTVVSYDPRGLGRSAVADPTLDVTAEVEADDLALLVESLGRGPADVLGSSGGAVAGLALATRHPDRVRTLVAHEPPVTVLLPDEREIDAVIDGIEETFRTAGSRAAWERFVALVSHDGPLGPAGVQDSTAAPVSPEPSPSAADRLFFLRMLKPFTRYRPDVEALRTGRPRIVIAVGESSGPEIARRAAEALADALGARPVAFPSHHGGFMDEPDAFAEKLRSVLDPTSSAPD